MSEDEKPSIDSLRQQAEGDPNPENLFLLAQQLSLAAESRPEARECCFRVLSEHPEHHRFRLLLAKLFYQDNMGEFCLRELATLREQVGEVSQLDRLIEALGGNTAAEAASSEEIAEIDVDVDFDEVEEEL